MTDLEKFIELYKSFGINCLTNERWDEKRGHGIIEITLNGSYGGNTTQSAKFRGYSCFFSSVVFHEDGTFIEQGFWE